MRIRVVAKVCVAGAVYVLLRSSVAVGQVAAGGGASGWFGAAELGARDFTQALTAQQKGMFDLYTDRPAGVLFQNLLLGYTPADSFRTIQLTAHNVGLLDQHLALAATQPGLFDVQLKWDRDVHTFSSDAVSLYTQTSPGVYTLPSPRPTTAAFNAAPYIAPLRSLWDPVKLSAALTPTSHWDFNFAYSHIGKSGDRPMGMSFGSPGNNASEILEPIDQTVHDLKVSQGYAQPRFQYMATYDLSMFQNGISSVTAANPLQATDSPTGGSANGRTALAPNNLAHTATITSGLNLPLRTRVNANVMESWWYQNAPYIPETINSAITSPLLAGVPKSLNGQAGTSMINASLSSRPISSINFSARIRSYSFRDDATGVAIPVLIINDRSISPADTARRDPFTRQNADASVTWRLPIPVSLTGGYGYERMERDSTVRNALQTGETTPRVSADFTGIEWLDLRTTYTKGWRRDHAYYQIDSSENPAFRRFDEANRDRERFDVLTGITPIDALTLNGDWEVGHDRYPNSQFGVLSDKTVALGADLEWTPTPRLALGGGVMREDYNNLQASQYRTGAQLANPTYVWVGNNTDLSVTTSANLTATVIPNRLLVGGTYGLTRSRFHMATYNPLAPTGGTATQNAAAAAYDLPVVSQSMQPIGSYVRCLLTPDWAVTVRYESELYAQSDYRTLGLVPVSANGSQLWLGNNFQNYDARYVTVTFSYRPGALKIGRPAM